MHSDLRRREVVVVKAHLGYRMEYCKIFSFCFSEVRVQLGALNFYLLNLGDLIAGHSLGHMVSFVLFTNL